jgi:hypothetical protein
MIVDEMVHIPIRNLRMVDDNDGYVKRASRELGGILGRVGTCTCRGCKRLA